MKGSNHKSADENKPEIEIINSEEEVTEEDTWMNSSGIGGYRLHIDNRIKKTQCCENDIEKTC